MVKGKLLSIAMASAVIIGSGFFGGEALAATSGNTNASFGVMPGTRDIEAPASTVFGNVTLDGTTKITTANPGKLVVSDNTGSGEGYKVSVQATPMREVAPAGGFAAGTAAKTLPAGSLSLSNSGATISPKGTTSPSPTWLGSNFVIDNGAVNILSAAVGQGMGIYDVTFGATALSLVLNPQTTFTDPKNYPSGATPYQSTITYTITTGP